MRELLSISNYLTTDVFIIFGVFILLFYTGYKLLKTEAKLREYQELIDHLDMQPVGKCHKEECNKTISADEMSKLIKRFFPYAYENTKGNLSKINISNHGKNAIIDNIARGVVKELATRK